MHVLFDPLDLNSYFSCADPRPGFLRSSPLWSICMLFVYKDIHKYILMFTYIQIYQAQFFMK